MAPRPEGTLNRHPTKENPPWPSARHVAPLVERLPVSRTKVSLKSLSRRRRPDRKHRRRAPCVGRPASAEARPRLGGLAELAHEAGDALVVAHHGEQAQASVARVAFEDVP